MPQRGELTCHILLHRQKRWHHDQHKKNAKPKTVDQRDHRRLQELRLNRALKQQRRQTQNRRQSRQHHGPQPICCAFNNRGHQPAFFGVFINRRHQNNRVIDDDPRHAQKAHHGEHRQRNVPVIVPPNRADQAKRNDRHHNQRPRPTAKDPGQHQINRRQAKDQTRARIVEELVFLLSQT